MAVHRLSDKAEMLARRIAASEGFGLGEWLSKLVVDYAVGLAFEHGDDLDTMPAPNPNERVLRV